MMKNIVEGLILAVVLMVVILNWPDREYVPLEGEVISKTTKQDLVPVGGTFMPVTVYYLRVSYADAEGVETLRDLRVEPKVYSGCWEGLHFERSSDGLVSCAIPERP